MIIRFIIWYLERKLSKMSITKLTEEQTTGLLSQLWENPAFRNYISDRNQKIIYTMVGAPGEKLGTRDEFIQLRGQRLEILELASKAKLCSERKINRK